MLYVVKIWQNFLQSEKKQTETYNVDAWGIVVWSDKKKTTDLSEKT